MDKENEIPVDDNSATNLTNRVPMEVNIVIETVKVTSKPKNKIAMKPSMKITGQGDHSVAKQREIRERYIAKGKDLSKL